MSALPKQKSAWFVYILRCADGTLYTGSTTDVERRVLEHNNIKRGAKYTRVRQPVVLAYAIQAENRSAAASQEAAIKKLTRAQKLQLIRGEI